MKSFRAAHCAAAAAVLTLALGTGLAIADDWYERVAPINDPLVKKECSACHMVYPSGLLPAPVWTSIMAGLQNHFGENAELDEATAKQITQYLTSNAAPNSRRTKLDVLRISEQPWFIRKHDKKDRITPATLKRRGAKSPADCKACHTRAEQGEFEDD